MMQQQEGIKKKLEQNEKSNQQERNSPAKYNKTGADRQKTRMRAMGAPRGPSALARLKIFSSGVNWPHDGVVHAAIIWMFPIWCASNEIITRWWFRGISCDGCLPPRPPRDASNVKLLEVHYRPGGGGCSHAAVAICGHCRVRRLGNSNSGRKMAANDSA